MKREDLIKLGVAEDVVDKIMAMNGQDIEKHKTDVVTAKQELDTVKGQLSEANKAIDGFKAMDIDGVKKAADEWKTKAEKAEADAKAQIEQIKFDNALSEALKTAKARNPKTVQALLKKDGLKLQEDGQMLGLKEQLDAIKSENDFLFESEDPDPKLTLGGNNHSVLSDSTIEAARKAAGLKTNGD